MAASSSHKRARHRSHTSERQTLGVRRRRGLANVCRRRPTHRQRCPDAWRFRDRSGFDGFWRALIAETAESSPPAVAVELSNATANPGEQIDVRAVIRDAALRDPNAGRPVQTM